MVAMKSVFIAFCTILLLCRNINTEVEATEESTYYRAAVVEVVPFTDEPFIPIEVVKKTLALFQQAINVAKSNDVDIIVFPETVLSTNAKKYINNRTALLGSMAVDVPNPRDADYNPCKDKNKFRTSYLLRKLSCLAEEGGVFLVANLIDYKYCNNFCEKLNNDSTSNCHEDKECPEDGFYFYNTNVVFNREGKLVVRYHKKYLFLEPLFHPSEDSEHGYFETDFGNFVTFICFDMLFGAAVDALEQTRAHNLAYPYFWHDHTPLMYFATALQQSFATLNKINLLAANGQSPVTGTVGSGIFSASNGALIYTYNPDGRSKLLISNVPKNPKENITVSEKDLKRKRYSSYNGIFYEDQIEENVEVVNECETEVVESPKDNMTDYQCQSTNLTAYTFAKLEYSEGTVDVCSNNFCCSASYKANSMEDDYFLVVAGGSFNLYDLHIYGIESCFLTRCHSDDGNTCTKLLLKSKTVFETIDLRGNFTTEYVYPFALNSDLRLTKKEEWSFDGKSRIYYRSLKHDSSLLFLSLHGRKYFQDVCF